MSDQPPVQISPATSPEEISTIRDLFLEYSATLNLDLTFQSFTQELAALPGAYSAPSGALLLARTHDGSALGCAALRPIRGEQGSCEMKRLYLRPAARGRALGRRLAVDVIDLARRAGYVRIRLDTLPSMTSARRLYAELGFVVTEAYYDTPLVGTVFMALDLTGLGDCAGEAE